MVIKYKNSFKVYVQREKMRVIVQFADIKTVIKTHKEYIRSINYDNKTVELKQSTPYGRHLL